MVVFVFFKEGSLVRLNYCFYDIAKCNFNYFIGEFYSAVVMRSCCFQILISHGIFALL